MGKSLKLEEYYPSALFLKASFEKYRNQLQSRFPEFDHHFVARLDQAIEKVGNIEKTNNVTQELKKVTSSLYAKSTELNTELNFVSYYFKRANLSTTLVTQLKKKIASGNIEASADLLKTLIQDCNANGKLLLEVGFNPTTTTVLSQYCKSIEDFNLLQNKKKNDLRSLHESNKLIYKELYSLISQICDAGKIMYKGTYIADEFTVTKIISRMRFS